MCTPEIPLVTQPARPRLRHMVFAMALTDADLAAHLAKLALRCEGGGLALPPNPAPQSQAG